MINNDDDDIDDDIITIAFIPSKLLSQRELREANQKSAMKGLAHKLPYVNLL